MYLLSVGIPYGGSDLRYLRMFDHVFVRTQADLRAARTVLPERDVTCFRDMAWSLPRQIRQTGLAAGGELRSHALSLTFTAMPVQWP